MKLGASLLNSFADFEVHEILTKELRPSITGVQGKYKSYGTPQRILLYFRKIDLRSMATATSENCSNVAGYIEIWVNLI